MEQEAQDLPQQEQEAQAVPQQEPPKKFKTNEQLNNLGGWKPPDEVIDQLEMWGLNFRYFSTLEYPFKHDNVLLDLLADRYNNNDRCFDINGVRFLFTLKDVFFITGLPIDGKPVTGIVKDIRSLFLEAFNIDTNEFDKRNSPIIDKRIKLAWLKRHFSTMDVTREDARWLPYIRAYVLYIIGSYIIVDSTGSCVHSRYLILLLNLTQVGSYAWGAAALASFYARLSDGHIHTLAYAFLVFAFEHMPSLFNVTIKHLQNVVLEDQPNSFPLIVKWSHLLYCPFKTTRHNNEKKVNYEAYLKGLVEDNFIWDPYERLREVEGFDVALIPKASAVTVLINFVTCIPHKTFTSPRQFGFQNVAEIDPNSIVQLPDVKEAPIKGPSTGLDYKTYVDVKENINYPAYNDAWNNRIPLRSVQEEQGDQPHLFGAAAEVDEPSEEQVEEEGEEPMEEQGDAWNNRIPLRLVQEEQGDQPHLFGAAAEVDEPSEEKVEEEEEEPMEEQGDAWNNRIPLRSVQEEQGDQPHLFGAAAEVDEPSEEQVFGAAIEEEEEEPMEEQDDAWNNRIPLRSVQEEQGDQPHLFCAAAEVDETSEEQVEEEEEELMEEQGDAWNNRIPLRSVREEQVDQPHFFGAAAFLYYPLLVPRDGVDEPSEEQVEEEEEEPMEEQGDAWNNRIPLRSVREEQGDQPHLFGAAAFLYYPLLVPRDGVDEPLEEQVEEEEEEPMEEQGDALNNRIPLCSVQEEQGDQPHLFGAAAEVDEPSEEQVEEEEEELMEEQGDAWNNRIPLRSVQVEEEEEEPMEEQGDQWHLFSATSEVDELEPPEEQGNSLI
ncbi:hypothetical protein Q3G72_000203 [Acer saccharum]|nr:hypothetical protein Q3G72_000203 [Acer saccharum]